MSLYSPSSPTIYRQEVILPLFLILLASCMPAYAQKTRSTPPLHGPVRIPIEAQGSRDKNGLYVLHGWLHVMNACPKVGDSKKAGDQKGNVSAPTAQFFLMDGKGLCVPLDISDETLLAQGGYLAINTRAITVRGLWRPVTGQSPLLGTQQSRTFQVRQLTLPVETSEEYAVSPNAVPSGFPYKTVPEGSDDTSEFMGATPSAAPVVGKSVPYVNLLVRFADSQNITPKPKSYYDTLFSDTAPGVGSFFREQSFGKMNIAGTQTVGWLNLPLPKSAYLDATQFWGFNWNKITVDACKVADSQVDFRQFYGINVLINESIGSVGGVGGTQTLTLDGRTGTWGTTMDNPVQGPQLMAHEMGHTLGWPHSSGSYGQVYDSQWDVMSNGYRWDAVNQQALAVGTIAFHHILPRYYRWSKTPWITDAECFVAQPGTDQTIRLERLTNPTNASGYKMAAVYVNSGSDFYTVEARRFIGSDAAGGIPAEGVLIHRVNLLRPDLPTGRSVAWVVDGDNNGNCNDAGAIWTPGETYTDNTRGISIQVVSGDATGYTVRLRVNNNVALPRDVTNTNDSGPGSLRDALIFANQFGGVNLRFRIPETDPNYFDGVFHIALNSALPEIMQSETVIDGTTQATFTGDTNPDGPEIEIDGSRISGWARGLSVYSGNNRFAGLSLINFLADGIAIEAGVSRSTDDWPYYGSRPKNGGYSNTITGCYVGVDATGTQVGGNKYNGIALYDGTSYTRIGDGTIEGRNILSSSLDGNGVYIDKSKYNVVYGNFIGTDRTGTRAIANKWQGILIYNGSSNNIVGGLSTGMGNLISGNKAPGIYIGGIKSSRNRIFGNRIGTDITGIAAIPNGSDGIAINEAATGNQIGGTAPNAGNLLSGNGGNGVWIGGTSSLNIVQGNRLGTNADGTDAIPNNYSGVTIAGAAFNNTIGGPVSGAGNLVSGNAGTGMWIGQTNTRQNIVQGNYIGLDITGKKAVPNQYDGIGLTNGTDSNQIGGTTPQARNLVSGNAGNGIWIGDAGTRGNIVEGNWFGLDSTGKKSVPNRYSGIALIRAAQNNRIGNATAGAANIVSGNSGGIYIGDTDTAFNQILGNIIGLGSDGTTILSNVGTSIVLNVGAHNNSIGSTDSLARNYIVSTADNAIWVGGSGTDNNTIEGNSIGLNTQGAAAGAIQYNGIAIVQGAKSNTIGGLTPASGNIIRGAGDGVRLADATTEQNRILGNQIYDNRFLGIRLTDGANGNLTAPTLLSATRQQVLGKLSPLPVGTYRVEVFGNLTTDSPAQGRVLLGSLSVTRSISTDSFTLSIPAQPIGTKITATATSTSGNTSAFSNAVIVP